MIFLHDETTGTRIKKLLKERGKTQIELADYCGVTPQTVNRWCADKLEPRANMIEKIAKFLQSNSLYLLNQTDVNVAIESLMLQENEFWEKHPEIYAECKKRDLLIQYIDLHGYDTTPIIAEEDGCKTVIPDIEECIELICHYYLKKKGENK